MFKIINNNQSKGVIKMYDILERITTDNLSKYLRIAGIKGSPSVKLKKNRTTDWRIQ